MIIPAINNTLQIYRGCSFDASFILSISNNGVVAPVDLREWDIKSQFKTVPNSDNPILTCTVLNNKIILTDAPNGVMSFVFSPTDTENLPSRLIYDIVLINILDSSRYVFAKGDVVVNDVITSLL